MEQALELTRTLRRAYGAVNAGDIEPALSVMRYDVDWPNTIEGGRERGRAAVRTYWTRLFGLVIPHFEPVQLTTAAPDQIVVRGHLRFSDPVSGQPLAHQHFEHVFSCCDGLVVRMDAAEPRLVELQPPRQAARAT